MKITYDTATNTLTVVLRDAPVRISEEEKSGVILNYEAEGRLIALEVLGRLDPRRRRAVPGDLQARRQATRGGGVIAAPTSATRARANEQILTERQGQLCAVKLTFSRRSATLGLQSVEVSLCPALRTRS